MTLVSTSDPSADTVHLAAPARWEERSTNRVLAARRDQILGRSRQIVEAGYELLEEEGWEGLTIRAVLKKTGLSRRALYERLPPTVIGPVGFSWPPIFGSFAGGRLRRN